MLAASDVRWLVRRGGKWNLPATPKIKAAYIRAFDRMLERRRERGLSCDWQTGVDVYHWWMEDGVMTSQTVMSEFEED